MEHPADEDAQPTNEAALPHLVIDPSINGPEGSFYTWDAAARKYEQRLAPWEVDDHLPKYPKYDTNLGDVDSFVAYLDRFESTENLPLITWHPERGVQALLDPAPKGPGHWVARLPFNKDWRWEAWEALCRGPKKQQDAIVAIEKLVDTIVTPPSGELLSLLAALRSTINSVSTLVVNEDGTTSVSFQKENTVGAGSTMTAKVPPLLTVQTPVFKGFPVTYALNVRVRVAPEEKGVLLYFSPLNNEAILEDVTKDIVGQLVAALNQGDNHPVKRDVLRA